MLLKRFKVKNFNSDRYIIDNFKFEDLSPEGYFFSTKKNIFDPKETYDKLELDYILYVTDVEYFLIRSRWLKTQNLADYVPNIDIELIQSQLVNLEMEQKELKKYIDLESEKSNKEKIVKELEKEIELYKNFKLKYDRLEEQFKDVGHFELLDLDKITSDLNLVNKEIEQHESSLLRSKGKVINSIKYVTKWNKVKVVVALLLTVLALYWLYFIRSEENQFVTNYFLPMVFINIALYLLLNSKSVESIVEQIEESPSIDRERGTNINVHHENLRTKRNQILRYTKADSVEDFFALKAKFNMIKKEKEKLESSNSLFSNLDNKEAELSSVLKELEDFKVLSAKYQSIEISKVRLKEIETKIEVLNRQRNHILKSILVKDNELQNSINSINLEFKQSLQSFFSSLTSSFNSYLPNIKNALIKLNIYDRFKAFLESQPLDMEIFKALGAKDILYLEFIFMFYLYQGKFDFFVSPFMFEILEINLFDEIWKDFESFAQILGIGDTTRVYLLEKEIIPYNLYL